MPPTKVNLRRLLKEDLDKPCIELSTYLLGKILVRKLEDNTILKGRIVETESYLGGEDKASNTYNGRQVIHIELYNKYYYLFIFITKTYCCK